MVLEGRVSNLFHHHTCSDVFPRPDVRYFCDLDYDPFLFMEDSNKIYGTSQYINNQVILPTHNSCFRLHDIYARLGANDTDLVEFYSRYGKTLVSRDATTLTGAN